MKPPPDADTNDAGVVSVNPILGYTVADTHPESESFIMKAYNLTNVSYKNRVTVVLSLAKTRTRTEMANFVDGGKQVAHVVSAGRP